jgi:DNA helicase-2/ATP-dependent DNA helicase PcrA
MHACLGRRIEAPLLRGAFCLPHLARAMMKGAVDSEFIRGTHWGRISLILILGVMSKLLQGLNDVQQQAALQQDGPILILAGAGSGKTRVLTHKVAYLIEQGVDPANILAVTFTNKAAGEMKSRLQHLLTPPGKKPNPGHIPSWVGTFHAICSRILRRQAASLGYSTNFVIYDSGDSLDLVKECMAELRLSVKEVNPNAVRAKISSAKNELVSPDEYQRFASDFLTRHVANVYPRYQAKLRENNAMDFDDLLVKTVELLQRHPDVLAYYQDVFLYLFIDEYQDTNEAQYLLVKLLAAKRRNLCVVGDMSQSIYAFRGATIKNIVNFEKDYPEAKIFHLEQNYRSTQNILTAATAIIQPNARAHTILKLWTDNGTGAPIMTYEAEDEQAEAQYIARRIGELVSNGLGSPASEWTKGEHDPSASADKPVRLSDIAILYRTNAQSRVLEEALLRAGIRYRLVGGVRFYDRREIKDVLSYLRLCINPHDSVAFNRVVNVPTRGIGPSTLLNGGPKLDKFLRLLEVFEKAAQELNVVDLLDFILTHIGYQAYLDDGTDEGRTRWENVQELRGSAAEFAPEGPGESLTNFLERVALVESESKSDKAAADEEMVTLMTLHAAKGLEFAVVFLVGLEEGIFPHVRALTDATELQEERRLAYVGVTRAKTLLHLTYAQQRLLFGSRSANPVSRFVIDVPEDILTTQRAASRLQGRLDGDEFGGRSGQWSGGNRWTDDWQDGPRPSRERQVKRDEAPLAYQAGDRVMHAVFGEGVIAELNRETVAVQFDDAGLKKLDPAFARLVKVE